MLIPYTFKWRRLGPENKSVHLVSVHLLKEVRNVMLACGWDYDQMLTYKRCPINTLIFRHFQSLNTVTCQQKLPSSCHSTNTTETKKLFRENWQFTCRTLTSHLVSVGSQVEPSNWRDTNTRTSRLRQTRKSILTSRWPFCATSTPC